MLVNLNRVLVPARKGGYAVGAFNFNNIEFVQAILGAAEEAKAPVILQTSEGAVKYLGFDYIGALAGVFKKTKIPVALHLDHGKDMEIIKQAIKSGFYTSVMIDGSSLSYEENVKMTKAVVKLARPKKISVEAELGVLKGKEEEISSAEHHFTDPKQAVDFVKQTGCDALAVAVGTSHGAYKFSGSPRLDLKRLESICRLVKVPLVLHGASGVLPRLLDLIKKDCDKISDCGRLAGAKGVPDEEIKQAIKLGVAKINIDTDLRIAFTAAIREKILSDRNFFDPREYLKPAREEVKKVVAEKITLFKPKD